MAKVHTNFATSSVAPACCRAGPSRRHSASRGRFNAPAPNRVRRRTCLPGRLLGPGGQPADRAPVVGRGDLRPEDEPVGADVRQRGHREPDPSTLRRPQQRRRPAQFGPDPIPPDCATLHQLHAESAADSVRPGRRTVQRLRPDHRYPRAVQGGRTQRPAGPGHGARRDEPRQPPAPLHRPRRERLHLRHRDRLRRRGVSARLGRADPHHALRTGRHQPAPGHRDRHPADRHLGQPHRGPARSAHDEPGPVHLPVPLHLLVRAGRRPERSVPAGRHRRGLPAKRTDLPGGRPGPTRAGA